MREYFRFDSTGGRYHDDRPLAGDRLVEGAYERITPATSRGKIRIYSETLDLYLCWEDGRLRFWDPATEEYLNDYDESEDARLAAEGALISERDTRLAAEARAEAAEAELKRLREQLDR